MLSYDGVIRKRLRLKGHPEIPPYNAQTGDEQALDGDGNGDRPPTGPAESSSPSVQAADDDVRDSRAEDGGALSGAAKSAEGGDAGANDGQPPEQAQDMRTEAEKRFNAVAEAREEERVMKEASKSYRDKVDQFNKRLAQAPEHNDMFNTSFTK